MHRLAILGIFLLNNLLSGCAFIQGMQGDAAADKQAAAQAANSQNSANTTIDTGTITSPVQPKTPAQNATTNAAKMIAPITR
jgi:hypothetical protein